MCIKVIQDEFLQAGRRARIDRPVPMWRQGRALLADTMMAAAGARGGVLLSQDGEAPLQQGEVPAAAPALLQALLSTPLPVVSGGRDGVELLWSAGPDAWGPLADAARQLGLRRLLLMVLREGNSTVAWVFLVDARAPGSSRRAALQAAGGALLSHARMEAQGRVTALQLQRLEDVAYAGGEWLWETDAAHCYTWLLRDVPCGPDDTALRVGEPMLHGEVVDWLGQPARPASSLRDVMELHQPIVRLVICEG